MSVDKPFDPKFTDEHHISINTGSRNLNDKVRLFIEWAIKENINILLPMFETEMLIALPYLPQKIRCITRCANIVRSAFIVSTLYLDRLSFVLTSSPRQFNLLHSQWGVPLSKLKLIPHGVDTSLFNYNPQKYRKNNELTLLYLGRIEDSAKGVMWLPSILDKLKKQNIAFQLHIIGSGPDLIKLKKAFYHYGIGEKIIYHGSMERAKLPDILSKAEIFIMTSRFEGFGFTLIEAMATGCVPIASHIAGVTDTIITHRVDGFLCPIGDTEKFAQKIATLATDPQKLAQMSQAARQKVENGFNLERMVTDYDQVFTEAMVMPPVSFSPHSLNRVVLPKELQPTWRTKIPQPIKNTIRKWVFRITGRMI